MMKRLLFLAAALVLTSLPVSVPAATPDAGAKPLRTITWDFTMGIGTVRRVQTSGLRSEGNNGVAGGTGSGNTSAGGASEAKGSIVVDVMGVAPEGIVVDVVENASGRGRPKVRVAITNAGGLTYDPKQSANLSEEEFVLLRMLARGFLVAEATAPGASWNVDGSANGISEVEHYAVKSKSNDEVALDYKMESSAKGANSFTATRLGSILYDAKYVVPVKLTYQEVVSQDRMGQSDRTTTSVDMKLTSDTFKKT